MLLLSFFFFLTNKFLNAQWLQTNGPIGGSVISYAYNTGNIFAGTGLGVFRSTNNGVNWLQTTLNNMETSSIVTIGNNVFAGGLNVGVFKSTDNGNTWNQSGLENLYVKSMAVKGDHIFAGTWNHGIYVSTNLGINWTQTSLNIYAYYVFT